MDAATLTLTLKQIRKTLRAVPAAERGGLHQMATRRCRDAEMFIERGVLNHAADLLETARFMVQA